VGRLAFLLGKRFERSNIISADAFNELEEKLALLPIIELIKIKALLPSDPRFPTLAFSATEEAFETE